MSVPGFLQTWNAVTVILATSGTVAWAQPASQDRAESPGIQFPAAVQGRPYVAALPLISAMGEVQSRVETACSHRA